MGSSGRVLRVLSVCVALLVGACAGSFPALDADAVRQPGAGGPATEGHRVISSHRVLTYTGVEGSEATARLETRSLRHFTTPKFTAWTETVSYSADVAETPVLRARLTAPRADARIVDDDAAGDASNSDMRSLTDARTRSLRIDGVRPGAVLQFESTERFRDAGRWSRAFSFARNPDAGLQQLEVRLPTGFSVDWASEPPGFAPTTRTDGETNVLTWVWAAADPASKPGAKRDHFWRVDVRLRGWPGSASPGSAPLRTAVEVSRWAAQLNEPQAVPTEAVRARVREILGPGEHTPEARARLLSDWVRRKVRYFAIAVGIGGWRAQAADFTLDRLYGDCKAKAVLLQAMLAAAGVPSRLALLESGWKPAEYVPIRAGANFNHMVLLVDLPDRTQLVDPTATFVPFGEVPAWDRDRDVLPVSLAGELPFREPATPAVDHGAEIGVELKVAADGRAAGRFTLRGRGDLAERLRERLAPLPAVAHARAIAEFLPIGGLVPEAVEARQLDVDQARTPVDAEGSLSRPEPLVLRGETAVVRPADLVGPCFPPATWGSDAKPHFLGTPHRDHLTVRLALPPGWQARPNDTPATRRTDAGEYALSLRAEPGVLVIERTCLLVRTALANTEAGLYTALRDTAKAAEGRPIVLRRVGGEP